ncbi:MAG: S8 family serine peptidase [Actinomycetaceae bacterium]|nr:S8 family serine peptidase [Actinomycetaceae bacterium]
MPHSRIRRTLITTIGVSLTACVALVSGSAQAALPLAPSDVLPAEPGPQSGNSTPASTQSGAAGILPESDVELTVTLPDGSVAENVPDRWFVEFESPSKAQGASEAAVQADVREFEEAVDRANIDATVTTTYGDLWNGVAIDAQQGDLTRLAALDEVASIRPVIVVPAPQLIHEDDGLSDAQRQEGLAAPTMTHASELGGVRSAQDLGYTGKGVTIGVIDSGVDYDHADLGGTGTSGPEVGGQADGSTAFPNKKVIGGWDFVGDEFASAASDIPQPDQYPDDCGGHGTHVAGIASAQGNPATGGIRGVAPDATIRAYRVFGCESNTSAELIAAALERAGNDGVDIVNMSIGTDYMVFADYPIPVSAAQLAERGVVVVISQGNVGDRGRWTMGGGGSHPGVITVGSVDNSIETNYYMTATSLPDRKMPYGLGEGAEVYIARSDSDAPEDNFSIVEAGQVPPDTEVLDHSDPALGCAPPQSPDIYKGKAVIIRRGGDLKNCSFYHKAKNAEAGGARLVVIDNNRASGTFSVTVASPNGRNLVKIPVVSISRADGDALRAAVRADSATTVKFPTPHSTFGIPTAGLVSEFSSWGLNSNLELKPDVVAPGGKIWSTWPLAMNPYQTTSGTSMAAPFVSGATALLMEAHPSIRQVDGQARTEEVAWRLRSTARPRAWSGDATAFEPMARQGAGLVDIHSAVTAKTWTSPSSLNLGQAADRGGSEDRTHQKVTLTNQDSRARTFTLSHVDAVSITGPAGTPTRSSAGAATVNTDGRTVTVDAGASVNLDIDITPPAGLDHADFYGGWIVATPTDGGNPVRIPYSGVGGDMAQAQLIADNKVDIVNEKAQIVDPEQYIFGYNDFHYQGMYNDPVRFNYVPDVPLKSVVMDVRPIAADGTVGEPLGVSLDGMIQRDWVRAITADAHAQKIPWSTIRPALGKVDPAQHFRSQPSTFGWDGSYLGQDQRRHQSPNGSYVVELHMLPIGEDGAQRADWKTWTSPKVTIDWAIDRSLDPTQFTVISPDGGKGAEDLIDGDAFTAVEVDSPQAQWVIDLRAIYQIEAVVLTPELVRTKTLGDYYKAEWSKDGVTWNLIAEKTHESVFIVPQDQTYLRPKVDPWAGVGEPEARYIRVTAHNTDQGDTQVAVGEVRLRGKKVADVPGIDHGQSGDSGQSGDAGQSDGGQSGDSGQSGDGGQSTRPGDMPQSSPPHVRPPSTPAPHTPGDNQGQSAPAPQRPGGHHSGDPQKPAPPSSTDHQTENKSSGAPSGPKPYAPAGPNKNGHAGTPLARTGTDAGIIGIYALMVGGIGALVMALRRARGSQPKG